MNPTHNDEHSHAQSQHEHSSTRPNDRHVLRSQQEKGHAHRLEAARLLEASRNLGEQVAEQAGKRPYVVIGAAAGVGFVAGSLFGSRLGQMLLMAGLGYVAKTVLGSEIGVDRIQAGIG